MKTFWFIILLFLFNLLSLSIFLHFLLKICLFCFLIFNSSKRKFSVYPSAYANAYASKVCAGKIKDDKGTKRKDFKGPKPSGGGGTGAAARRIRKAGLGLMMLAGKKNRRKVRDEMKDNNLLQHKLL